MFGDSKGRAFTVAEVLGATATESFSNIEKGERGASLSGLRNVCSFVMQGVWGAG